MNQRVSLVESQDERSDADRFEWMRFDDAQFNDRDQDVKLIKKVADESFDSVNSLRVMLNKLISSCPCCDYNDLYEVMLLISIQCEKECFDKSKQNYLVSAIAACCNSSANQSQCVVTDSGKPNMDVHIHQIEGRSSDQQTYCLVTVSILAEDQNHADFLIRVINANTTQTDSARYWPSVTRGLQEEIFGRDGSDWDSHVADYEVKLEDDPVIRQPRSDFLQFSSNVFSFIEDKKPFHRILIVGGRSPHRFDFLKWISGLPFLSEPASLKSDIAREHNFTILSKSNDPLHYREFILKTRLQQLDINLKQAMMYSFEKMQRIFREYISSENPRGNITCAEFVRVFASLELNGPEGQIIKVSDSQAEDVFEKADVDKVGSISLNDFLLFWENLYTQFQGKQPTQTLEGSAPKAQQSRLEHLHQRLRATKSALKESQSLANQKITQIRAEKKASLMLERAEAFSQVCKKKVEKANATIQTQRSIIANEASSTIAVKKANEVINATKKLLIGAEASLDKASRQEALARAAMADASDAADLLESNESPLDEFELIRMCLQYLARGSGLEDGVRRLIADLDQNHDGVLSTRELCAGLSSMLKEQGVRMRRGMIELVCGWLDADGSGFIEVNELKLAISASSDKKSRCRSFGGLTCLARYRGNARIVWEDASGEIHTWKPRPSNDQQARGMFFDAMIGPCEKEGSLRVAFTRGKSPASSLYSILTDIPNSKCTVFQQCEHNEILIRCASGPLLSLKLFFDSPIEAYQAVLIEYLSGLIQRELRRGIELPNFSNTDRETPGIANLGEKFRQALLLGSPALTLFNKEKGLFHLWEQILRQRPQCAEIRAKQEEFTIEEFKVESLISILQVEKAKIKEFWVTWAALHLNEAEADIETSKYTEKISAFIDEVRNSSSANYHNISSAGPEITSMLSIVLESCLGGEIMTCLNPDLIHMPRPVVLQAPELFDINYPRSPESARILDILRFYFPDTSSDLLLEDQIRNRFSEYDRDKSGLLDHKELMALIKKCVNKKPRGARNGTGRFESQEAEFLTDAEIRALIEIMDPNGKKYLGVKDLINVLIPRGSRCEYDQLRAFEIFGTSSDRIAILVDPVYSSMNLWELSVIKLLHKRFSSKIIFLTFVSIEHMIDFSPEDIKSKINFAAACLSKYLQDKRVGNQIQENVLGVCMDVSSQRTREQSKLWKSALHSNFSRIIAKLFSNEEDFVSSLIFKLSESIRIITLSLGKTLRAQQRKSKDGNVSESERLQFASAAHSLISVCNTLIQRFEEVICLLRVLDLQISIQMAKNVCKKCKATARRILVELKMDTVTMADQERAIMEERNKRLEAEKAVRAGDVLSWITPEHLCIWIDEFSARNNLNDEISKTVRDLLRQGKSNDVSSLVDMNLEAFSKDLRKRKIDQEDVCVIIQEFQRVRGLFWKVNPTISHRNLWLLAREQFLRIEDVRLFYSVLSGQFVVPFHLKAALLDCLESLTGGLCTRCRLSTIAVNCAYEVFSDDGASIQHQVERHFFTDSTGDPTTSYPITRAKISAEAVSELLMTLRRSFIHSIGWSPPASD